MATEQDFSLVVTAHRGGPMLEECLASAARLDPKPREVIVAVDGSDPDVLRLASAHGFRAVASGEPRGVSATRNAGAQACEGSVIAFVDSDVLLPPDHIARAAALFVESPEISAAIGSYDDAPAAPGTVSRYRNLLHHYTHKHGSREARTFWSGCGAVRREAFASAGGFDETYLEPSVEDIELGYRLRSAGHRIRLEPGWQVKHLKQWKLRDLLVTDIFRRALPWSRLIRREGRLDNDLNIDRRARLSAILVCGAVGALAGGMFFHPVLLLVPLFLVSATALNWRFYRFLASRGGWAFAAASIPLHWSYFLGATAGFVLGLSRAPSA